MNASMLRQSPIVHAEKELESMLTHLSHLIKLGVKGPALTSWSQWHGIDLPANLYDVLSLDEHSSLVRVGSEEIVLECPENDPHLLKIEETFRHPMPGLYRIEQQSVTLDLKGDLVLRVLAQTCGVDPTQQPAGRIFYTRVAGVSCGIVVRNTVGERFYRIWVDYTLAPYLWETLSDIIREI